MLQLSHWFEMVSRAIAFIESFVAACWTLASAGSFPGAKPGPHARRDGCLTVDDFKMLEIGETQVRAQLRREPASIAREVSAPAGLARWLPLADCSAGVQWCGRDARPPAQDQHSGTRGGRLLLRPAGALAAATGLGSELALTTASWVRSTDERSRRRS